MFCGSVSVPFAREAITDEHRWTRITSERLFLGGCDICVIRRAIGGLAQIASDTTWQDPPWAGGLLAVSGLNRKLIAGR